VWGHITIATCPAQAEDKIVEPDYQWGGSYSEKENNDLWKEAPKDGVIVSRKPWEKLWKAWHASAENPNKEAPKVDFEKKLVLVAAGSGPNVIKIEDLKLSDKGDLQFKWSITERKGNGFVFDLLQVSREGIKTVNGKEL
jgi:hypothetical protein